MERFEEIINILLEKKAAINEKKEQAIKEAIEKVDAEYGEDARKIDELLRTAGYVEEEKVEEVVVDEPKEEIVENTETETIEETEPANEVVEEQVEEQVKKPFNPFFKN